jgi:glycosyltransferase involved in cell wall biosynthesis
VSARVLFVANAYPDEERPYYGTYNHAEVTALRAAGVEVDVLAVRGYAGRSQYLRGALEMLRRNADGRSHDIVHASYGLMGIVARLDVRRPLVVSFTGGDIQGNPDASGRLPRSARLAARAYANAARLAAATITKTEAMARLLPWSVRARNHVIAEGVDVRRFDGISRDEARARLGWDTAEPTVIFVADPARHVKNFPLAEAAVSLLPRARLRVAATVPHAEIPLWMAAADALVLTSRSEGSPNVIREAMAARLPAVSTPVGDVPGLFAGIPGCYVREPRAAALAEGLERALEHGRTPEARRAVERFDVAVTTRRIVSVYDAVLARRRGG